MEISEIEKITIIFPPGDQLTSLLIQKEANTNLEQLLNKLCALRAIEFDQKKLAVLSDIGEPINLNQTVKQSNLCFIEIVDKKTAAKASKEKKKRDKVTGRPPLENAKPIVGKLCQIPLMEQLYDDEKKLLEEIKAKETELCAYFSDEFVVYCILSRKMDYNRVVEQLKKSLQFRKDYGYLNIPKFSELSPEIFEAVYTIPGSRDKLGRGLRYFKSSKIHPSDPSFSVDNVTKFFTWYAFVGVYGDGIDGIRCGVHMVNDMADSGWKNFDVELQRRLISVMLQAFPMLIRRVDIINPLRIVNALLSIMKTLGISKKLGDRFSQTTTKKLLKHVDADNLDKSVGGNIDFAPREFYAFMREWAEKHEDRLRAPGSTQ